MASCDAKFGEVGGCPFSGPTCRAQQLPFTARKRIAEGNPEERDAGKLEVPAQLFEVVHEDRDRVADRLGRQPNYLGKDYGRWQLYEVALADVDLRGLVMQCTVLEADLSLAEAVVVRAIETVDPIDRQIWVELVEPGRSREFVETRRNELEILDKVEEIEFGASIEVTDGWSNWLLLRVAAQATDLPFLATLAEAGRTKRIRRTAAERITQVSQKPA